ncbi:MAG: thioredoxin-disulfide reductase [Ruminococcaceae bacterium]|nr:thioredoxin-disulfide reductase [Oscillospiraceae bacterium]
MKDIIIIGGGPAGLSAAIYAKRAGCDVCVFEKMSPGGQVMTTPEIENYPGFVGTGFDLSMNMFDQVKGLNVEFEYETIDRIEKNDGVFYIYSADGKEFTARSVIIASGAKRRLLEVEGESEFTGRGVSYCATCDGNFFKDRVAVVVGGGNTAVEDAIYLSNICEKVYIIHRRDEFRASKVLVERMNSIEKIEAIFNTVPVAISGTETVESLVVKNKITNEESVLSTDAVFVAVGTVPETSFVSDMVSYDNAGYIQTDEKCMTKTEGLYAVGDVRNTLLKQVITAAADGAVAATFSAEYVQNLKL